MIVHYGMQSTHRQAMDDLVGTCYDKIKGCDAVASCSEIRPQLIPSLLKRLETERNREWKG
jgi:hypothetical protein